MSRAAMLSIGGLLLLSLLGCEGLARPTVTPSRTPSGPTLAPSAVRRPLFPTEVPADFEAVGRNDPTAASLPSGAGLPPMPIGTQAIGAGQTVEVTAADGTLLLGELYQVGTLRLPGVLILGPEISSWGDFPSQLHNAGFTVLVVAMRSPAVQDDFGALMASLSSGIADPGRIAVIGAREGADMALIGCAADRLCDAVVLLSPLQRDLLLNAMIAYNPRPILVLASPEDAESFPGAREVADAARGERLFQPVENGGQGVRMLQVRPDVGTLIVTWLAEQVSGIP